MSNPHLPAEILDHAVNFLHNEKSALRDCCLLSKSWIPHTRKHLFAHIKFETETELQVWKETFPDPSTSPAHHAQTLSIGCTDAVTAADAESGGWITGFSRVVHFEVVDPADGSPDTYTMTSFLPFHGFSPVVKSLRVDFATLPLSQIFNLILSFPLLNDLSVIASEASADNEDSSNHC